MYGWIIGFTPRYTTKLVQSIQMNKLLQDRNIPNGKIPLPAVIYLFCEPQDVLEVEYCPVIKVTGSAECSEVLVLLGFDEQKVGGAASVHISFEGELEMSLLILNAPILIWVLPIEGECHFTKLVDDMVVDDGILACRTSVRETISEIQAERNIFHQG